VGQIAGVLVLAKSFGIYGLSYGVILGAVLHLGIQIPGLFRYGFKWAPTFDWKDSRIRKVSRLIGPRILNVAFFQLVFISTDRFASGLYEGAISAINYGWLIMQMPETIIGTAAATALLPTLADLAARGDKVELKRTLRRAILIIISLTIPVTIVAMLVVRPVVKLVFEGRNFTASGTDLVVAAALMFLPGITGQALVEIGVRAFYALQKPMIPLVAAGLNVGLFIGLCLILMPVMGHSGIALANTLAFSCQALGLLFLLRRQGVL
jgi:putative peptidoglycan lipid II flippase